MLFVFCVCCENCNRYYVRGKLFACFFLFCICTVLFQDGWCRGPVSLKKGKVLYLYLCFLYLCSLVFVDLLDNERGPLDSVCTQRKYICVFYLFILYIYLDRGWKPLDGVCT